jgi:hypothetical protein
MMSRVIFSLEKKSDLIVLIPLPSAHWRREIVLARRSHRNLVPATRLLMQEFEKQAQLTD